MQNAWKETSTHLHFVKIDAVSNIVRAHHVILSLLWTVLLIGSASGCIFLIVDTLHQYSSYRVSTTTRYLSEQESVFPTILVCNRNAFSTDFAITLLDSASIEYKGGPNALGSVKTNYNVYNELQGYLNRTRGYLLTDEEKKNMSTLMSDMLWQCSFNDDKCSASDFEFVFHPLLLACYRFNGNGSKTTSLVGLTVQLDIEMFVGLPNDLGKSTKARGIYIYLLNSTDYPFNYATAPIVLSSGLSMNIVPQRQFYTQYPTPYSDCNVHADDTLAVNNLSDRQLFDAVVATGYKYSQRTCFEFCQQLVTVETCDCLQLSIDDFSLSSTYEYCLSQNQTSCVKGVSANFTSSDVLNALCLARCPLECEERILQPFLSTSTYPPSETYANIIRQNGRLNQTFYDTTDWMQDMPKSVLQLTVYYNSLSYVEIEEEPKMSAEDLLGLLGGHLHLFLGMSLLSFVELFEFAILFLFASVTSGTTRRIKVNSAKN